MVYSVGYTTRAGGKTGRDGRHVAARYLAGKKFPKLPVLTESARCTLPTTFVSRGGLTWGVVATPGRIALHANADSGQLALWRVAVRNGAGSAQHHVVCSGIGRVGSKMEKGSTSPSRWRLFATRQSIPTVTRVSRGASSSFQDYRHNALGSFNESRVGADRGLRDERLGALQPGLARLRVRHRRARSVKTVSTRCIHCPWPW